MESLYRKYRPLTFGSVVGQQHIVSTLEHAVAEGRLSHAYLFCGPRGTGKTTMARILAKSLLCEGAEAARAEGASGCMPDGTCPECEAIAAGTHPDVYELDAASRTGVDNVREEIINSVSFAPVRGAYKVYIIDEVHMLTTAAFNALLKTLEEPPSHVIFVLCTTDPQKILETILSRCQRFDFHRISNDDIVGRLRYICEQESFAFDDEALEIVARHARGGMRDALSTLEQLSVFGDGSVRVDDARSLLGEVASTVLSEFSQKIAERNTVELFGLVRAQADEGNDLMELTHDLVAHMRDVYTASIAGAKPELFDGTPEEVAALVEEARLFGDPDRLARALTLLDDAALEMRDASDPRLVLEIALTRLARPESDLTIEALAERLARLEAQIAAGVPSAPMTPAQRAAAVGESHGVPAAAVAAPRTPHAGGAGARGAGAVPARGAGAAPAAPAAATVPAAATAPAAAASVSGVPSAGSSAGAPAAPGAAARAAAPVMGGASASSTPAAASAPASNPAPARSAAPHGGAAAVPADQQRVTVPASAQPEMAACAVTPPAANDSELQRRWIEVVKRITAAQPSRGALLQNSRAVSDDGQTLTIAFPQGSTFALKMITRPDSNAIVLPVVCQVFGKRTVTYEMEGAPAAPASAAQAAPAPSVAPGASRPTPGVVPSSAQAAAPTQGAASSGASPAQASAPAPAQVAAASSPAQAASTPSPVNASAPAAGPAAVPAPAAAPVAQPAAPSPAPQGASAPTVAHAERVDQKSGPTFLPEPDIDADRKAWMDEQVPYDDAAIAAYTDDAEVPPFDAPAAVPAAVEAPAAAAPALAATPSAPADSAASVAPAVASSATPSDPAPAQPAPGQQPEQGDAAQENVDPKAVIESIWGNVVFK